MKYVIKINYICFYFLLCGHWLPRWHSGKESTCHCRRRRRFGFDFWVKEDPWSKKWRPTPVFLPGKSHGQRRLTGYKESQRVRHDRD